MDSQGKFQVGDRVTIVYKGKIYHAAKVGTVTHVHIMVQVTWGDGHTEKYHQSELTYLPTKEKK